MFKLIEIIAQKISKKLCQSDGNNEYYDYYEYSLIGYISFIIYSLFVVAISILLGYFPYLFIAMFSFLSIRSPSGGSHAKNALWCFISTNIVFILIGSSTYLNKYFLILFLFSFIVFSGLEYIPKYTKTATQHSEEKQRYFQLSYVSRLFIIFILNVLSIVLYLNCYDLTILGISIDFSKVSCVISTSAIMNRFMLSDLCFKLLDLTGKDIEQ